MRVNVTLKDATTAEAVPFAYLAVNEGGNYRTVAQADVDGRAFFDFPTGNTVNLKVATIGYQDRFTSFPADGSPQTVEMFSKTTELRPVVVERERPKTSNAGLYAGLAILAVLVLASGGHRRR